MAFTITIRDISSGIDLDPSNLTGVISKEQIDIPYPNGLPGNLEEETPVTTLRPRISKIAGCPPCDCRPPDVRYEDVIHTILSVLSVYNNFPITQIKNINMVSPAPQSSPLPAPSNGNSSGEKSGSQLVIVQDDSSKSFVKLNGF